MHHGCFGAIRRSAASGCDLCKLIVDVADSRTDGNTQIDSSSYIADWENDE
jgi:hypothetical protein